MGSRPKFLRAVLFLNSALLTRIGPERTYSQTGLSPFMAGDVFSTRDSSFLMHNNIVTKTVSYIVGAGKKARAFTHNQVSQASFRERDKRKTCF
jgi:hypothetical protein